MRLIPSQPEVTDSGQGGLSGLSGVQLSPERQQLLELALTTCGGSAPWQGRKRAEARDLVALSQLAPPGRMELEHLDLRVDLRVVVLLRVPVPCLPHPEGELQVAPLAVLGVTYPQEALRRALPGYAFVQILAPAFVWLANVAFDRAQPLCLGAKLPAGIRVKELVLLAYGALSMQNYMFDEQDPAGVLNPAAARWWQQNLARIPLSRTPFLGACSSRVPGASAANWENQGGRQS
jgi:hypothetical protein